MEQKCGNCIYLDEKDKKEAGNWFSGYSDEFYCRDLHRYVGVNDGRSCRYYREVPHNHSSGGCFITTIVVKINGYDDKCELLQILRSFRNNILQKSDDGLDILKEYDVVGPKLSIEIENDQNSKILSLKLLSNYIIPTVELIKKQDYKKATDIYKSMINYLKIKYNISFNQNDYEYDSSVKISQTGHGTARVKKIS